MSSSQELAAIAEKAAEVVERGWCQRTLKDDQGNHCAIGSLNEALGEPQEPWKLPTEIYNVLTQAAADVLYENSTKRAD